jgi:GT2 family glycosyltransferase
VADLVDISSEPLPQPAYRSDPRARSEAAPTSTEAHQRSSYLVALEYDERAYLATYDDVILSLDTGEFRNAKEHFEQFGRREGRHADERYIRALGLGPQSPVLQDALPLSIDTVVLGVTGTALVIGWTDDRESPLVSLSIIAGREYGWNTTAFGRLRRGDVEALLQGPPGHLYGFWAVIQLKPSLPVGDPWVIRGRLADGRFRESYCPVRVVSDVELRATVLRYFAAAEFYGNRAIESFLSLGSGIGAELVDLNRRITQSISAGAWVSYYGPRRNDYIGSIIITLFGKSEFFFLQAALFSVALACDRYEFVFVSNSPELTEILQRETTICSRIYGISIVLVCLPDNAGFGAANNIGARFARSPRLLITNPDIFPRDTHWAQRHTEIIATQPRDQTLIFGAPLYYDDGSLMHHGMYFEIDEGMSVRPDAISTCPMIRVEHYAKGAPAWSPRFRCPRPVPASSGAFISVDRAWFEELGGFTEDFIFGHYEDADLCLKSLTRGKPVWIQDLPLWHMEGKGSTRRPEHEGGSMVNRWLFTLQWGDFIADELLGPNPACLMLQPPLPAALAAVPPEPTKPQRRSRAIRRPSSPHSATVDR